MNENTKDPKNLIITVLVILLVGSIGASFYFSRKGPILLGQEPGKEICDALPLFTGSFEGGSSEMMPYIAQDVCHTVFASEKSDSAICNKIKTAEFKGQCYSAVATKMGDVSVCDAAPPDARDRCYSQVANTLGGTATCEKIQQINERDNCIQNYAMRASDSAACRKITNIGSRDNCFMNLAHQNPALCAEVSNPQMRGDCQRNVGR